MNRAMVFDDETIQKLFGFEDAESESIERLKEYYFKKDTFDRVTAELPLRILVGHKGTGKSALFKVAISEEKEAGNLPSLMILRNWVKTTKTFFYEFVNGNMD